MTIAWHMIVPGLILGCIIGEVWIRIFKQYRHQETVTH